jgi:hypothetical protein
MKLKLSAFALLVCCVPLLLTSCFSFNSFSGRNVTVAIQPQIKSISINTSQTFTTVTRNAPNVPLWSINGNYKSGVSTPSGVFVTTSSAPASAVYTAPAVPPIYTDAQISAGAIQGSVLLGAGVSIDQSPFDQFIATETFAIIGPISVGLSPSCASVQTSGTQQFNAYVVGSLNTALTWQVQTTTGGGTDFGSISITGLYTAPTTIPVTGKSITVTAISQADPTKSASSVVTLTSP